MEKGSEQPAEEKNIKEDKLNIENSKEESGGLKMKYLNFAEARALEPDGVWQNQDPETLSALICELSEHDDFSHSHVEKIKNIWEELKKRNPTNEILSRVIGKIGNAHRNGLDTKIRREAWVLLKENNPTIETIVALIPILDRELIGDGGKQTTQNEAWEILINKEPTIEELYSFTKQSSHLPQRFRDIAVKELERRGIDDKKLEELRVKEYEKLVKEYDKK